MLILFQKPFSSFKNVSMIHSASKPESSYPMAVLMVAKEMLKFEYKLGQGLRAVGCGSLALVELSNNKGRFGLGYEPTHEELFQVFRGKKRKCTTSRMPIHIRTTFLALVEVIMLEPFKELEDEELDLACIIWICLEEFSLNAIISPEDNSTSTI